MKSVIRTKCRLAAGGIVSSLLMFSLLSSQLVDSKPTEPTPESTATGEEKAPPQQGAVSKTGTAPEEITDVEALRNEQISKATEHFDTAHSYVKHGDFNLAAIEMQEAIAAAPQVKAYHRDYCLIALAKLQPALATAEFMLATGLGDPIPYTEKEKRDLDQNAATLHYNKGIGYGRKSKWTQAVEELQKAITYAPDSAKFRHSLAFALGSEGRFDLAEKTYQQSLGLLPEDAFAHADFAFLLSDKGQKQSAYDQLAQAVALQPQSPALRVDLAWLAENKGDFKKASEEIKEAIKLSPGHAALWSHLGRVLEHEGDITEAKAAYTKAVALDPEQDQAQESLKKLTGK